MNVISTEKGLYEYSGVLRRVCYEFSIHDALRLGDYYVICSPQEGVIYGREKVIDRECWRLVRIDDGVYASLAGPVIYDVVRRRVVLDLTSMARERG